MAVQYKLVQRPDMRRGAIAGEKLYYAMSSTTGRCSVETLYDVVADRACVTRGDVEAVLEGFLKVVIMRLKDGQRVELGRFGHISTALGSSGVKDPADFKSSMIKSRRVVFRPSARLQAVARKLKVERIEQPGLKPATPPEGGGEDVLE